MALARLLVYITLAMLDLDTVICTCSFPNYTTYHPKWETKISLERSVIGAYWIFNETVAEFINLSKSETSYKYSCDAAISSDTFLVKLNPEEKKKDQSLESANTDESIIFMCVQFSQHSNSILQLKLSPLSVFAPKEIICGGSHSSWDNQILVWPRMTNYDVCPITGGYQFSMTDPSNGIKLCANLYLPPVLESECVKEEGIYIDFRNFLCRGSLGMQLTQWLACLGSWTEENFTFSVVTDHDETWPRVWLLRFPIRIQGDSFQAEIFKEVKAITAQSIDPSTDYYILQMTKKSFPSTCEDEAIECNNCSSGSTRIYCQKSCDLCLSQQQCNFSNNTLGSWVQFSSSGTQNVNVSTSTLTFGQTSYSCLNLSKNSWYITDGRRPLTITFSNGCRPRYLCVDFVQKSYSVLQYRLSQYVPWSPAVPMTTENICGENLFADSKTSPVTDPNRHKYKVIVRNDEPHQNISCSLGGGHFHLLAHFPSGKKCNVLIDLCKNQLNTSFEVVTSNSCDDSYLLGTEQYCLASFTDDTNGDLVVITEDVNTSIAYCWIVHKDEWEPRPKLFFTYAADCNSNTAKYILYMNYTGYLAYFDIAFGPGVLGSYSCLENTTFLQNTSINANMLENNHSKEGLHNSSTSVIITPTIHWNPEKVAENSQAPDPSQTTRNQGQRSMLTKHLFLLLTSCLVLCRHL